MRSFTVVLVSVVLTLAVPEVGQAQAQDRHRAAARELLTVTDAPGMMRDTRAIARQQIANQLKGTALEADRVMALVDDFLDQQLQWSALEPAFIEMYVEVFSENELREMAEFYRTDLGQLMLNRLPDVMRRSMTISQQRLQAGLPGFLAQLQSLLLPDTMSVQR